MQYAVAIHFAEKRGMRVAPRESKRLADLLAGVATLEGLQPTALDDVSLIRHDKPQPRAPFVYEPSVIFVAQGRKTGYLGREVFTYDPHNYLVLSVPLPIECETLASAKNPLLAMSLKVNLTALSELLLEMEESSPSQETTPRGIYSAPFTQTLYGAVIRLAECLHSPTECRVLGPSIVRETIYRVLHNERGGALQALATRHGRFNRISRVLRRIHAEYSHALDVETLAREANMSVSTFHYKFKAVTSTSPLQYLKSIRLHKARLLMMQEGINAKLAADKVGYESPSQFSREFKRLFGRSPIEETGRMKVAFQDAHQRRDTGPCKG